MSFIPSTHFWDGNGAQSLRYNRNKMRYLRTFIPEKGIKIFSFLLYHTEPLNSDCCYTWSFIYCVNCNYHYKSLLVTFLRILLALLNGHNHGIILCCKW